MSRRSIAYAHAQPCLCHVAGISPAFPQIEGNIDMALWLGENSGQRLGPALLIYARTGRGMARVPVEISRGHVRFSRNFLFPLSINSMNHITGIDPQSSGSFSRGGLENQGVLDLK